MKNYSKILTLVLVFLVSAFSCGANENILNVYIWGNYLPLDVLQQFTKETKIKVNLIEYDNNETMFAKLKALKHSDYDIVVPSSYFVERMQKHGMLHQINKKKLTNFKNIHPVLRNLAFDPQNQYSVPYLWGSTGIIINSKYIKKNKVYSWQNFWESKYSDQLMLLNDMRDVFSMAFLSLGYSVNDSNPIHIEQAYIKLKKLLPNVKIFSIDAVPNIYIDEDAFIGMAWSGDCKLAQEENKDLEYIYPAEGFALWVDSLVILKNAPHLDNAYKLINFILRPEIAKQISLATGHSTANLAAVKLLPPELRYNQVANPRPAIMKRGKIQTDLNEKTRVLYEKYWEKLKIAD